jgi:aminoglycoside phosphotransferase (APT) family kinase protein
MGPCSYEFERSYAAKVVLQLERKGTISREESVHFLGLFELWIDSLLRLKRKKAILHGDVTPTNFIFPGEGEIVAIDLERMRMGDPIYDLGFVCAEIKHAFLWRRGDWFSSEPYIRAFLEFYCEKKEDSQRSFEEITRDLPFFMAICELRIARNEYLESSYRRRLCEEARRCLFSGLSVLF